MTKYDRKGYKARPRQLLLTSNCAVIVEEAKLKQRIDYAALKGQRSHGSGGEDGLGSNAVSIEISVYFLNGLNGNGIDPCPGLLLSGVLTEATLNWSE